MDDKKSFFIESTHRRPRLIRARASKPEQNQGDTMTSTKIICHRDGTTTYFSVYHQTWQKRVTMPDREIAALSRTEQNRIIRHQKAHQ